MASNRSKALMLWALRRLYSTQNQTTKSLSGLPIPNLFHFISSAIPPFQNSSDSMGTTLFTTYRFSCNFHHPKLPSPNLHPHSISIADGENEKLLGILNRRSILVSGLSLLSTAPLEPQNHCLAAVKQGLLAGRIPGLSEPDEQGWRTYRRPDEKSGGHGVGWSPIIPYVFSVPQDWEEVPVSIADLGGTEIDLRFGSSKEGRLFVIVAPVRRFSDVIGEDATIEMVGPPEKVINAFGPEVIGENVEGKVINMNVAEHSGRTYYQFELEPPHVLITATAAGNRLYLFNVTANGLQWKRHYGDLKRIADSFRVV